ncbi:MAG: methyltransferase domain-containing protein [Chthoniobacteraceae bacterium]
MTDWEARYQNHDMPWEKGAPSPGLVDFLGTQPLQGRILVPGCGFGHDVRAIATTENEVVGLDLAPSAVEAAREQVARHGERYVLGDLFALPEDWAGTFDWVFEHTCFCAIDPAMRATYVESVARALKPGGHLLAVFFLNPDLEPGHYGPPFGVGEAELDASFAPHFTVLRQWTPDHAYPDRGGREQMRLLRRH